MTYRSRDGKAPLCATFQTFGCSIVDLLELPEKNNHSGQDIKSELLERIQGNTGVSESKDEATSTIKVADTTNKVKKMRQHWRERQGGGKVEPNKVPTRAQAPPHAAAPHA